jgi:hypothetical protein
MEAVVKADLSEAVIASCGLGDRMDLGKITTSGLFQQHMLALIETCDGNVAQPIVRSRDRNRRKIRLLGDFLPVGCCSSADLGGKRVRPFARDIGN